jgi:glycosyltransferase involved in cell wall biosynthesis
MSVGAAAQQPVETVGGAADKRVLVILPALNEAATIREVIARIPRYIAGVAEVRILVVDDGSTDATASVVASFGDAVTALRQPARGVAAALNAGIAASTGDVLAFLDADDLWEPDKLRRQLDVLEREPDVEVVLGLSRQFLSPDADPAATARVRVPDEPVAGVQKTAMLLRRSAFDRVGAFDETVVAADFVDWWARAVEAGLRTTYVDAVVCHRRIHGDNLGIRHRDRQREEQLDVLKASLDRRRRASEQP